MLYSVVAKLNLAEKVIYKYRLHLSGAPVDPSPFFEIFTGRHMYLPLEFPVLAFTSIARTRRRHYIGAALNAELAEAELSAVRRYAQAHEIGHILLRHRSDLVLWREGYEPYSSANKTASLQDEASDYIAAYILIPRDTLVELSSEDPAYIARYVDVPYHLVPLRQEIRFKLGR